MTVKYIIRQYKIDFNENVKVSIVPIECMLIKEVILNVDLPYMYGQ